MIEDIFNDIYIRNFKKSNFVVYHMSVIHSYDSYIYIYIYIYMYAFKNVKYYFAIMFVHVQIYGIKT